MSDFKCEFCGSKTMMIETPYMERTSDWPPKYVPTKTYCCKTQAKNQKYQSHHIIKE